MMLHVVKGESLLELSPKMAHFENQFQYPLGEDKTFSISHGKDYTAFYRSMGESICLIAEENEKILGKMYCSFRKIKNGTSDTLVAYLGGLKTSKAFKKNSFVYYKIANEMIELVKVKTNIAISVVMEGTSRNPGDYTGRLNIPLFHKIDKVCIFHFNTMIDNPDWKGNEVLKENYLDIFSRLNQGNYFYPDNISLRSKLLLKCFVSDDGKSCGILEDTVKAKRLFLSDNNELFSSHLSYFGFSSIEAAVGIIEQALYTSFQNGFPKMFLALDEPNAEILIPHLHHLKYDMFAAHIYGTEAAKSFKFSINSSEI